MDESQTDKSKECVTEESVDNEDKRGQHNRGHKQEGDGKKDSRSSYENFMTCNSVLHRMNWNLNVTPDRPSSNPVDIDKTLEKILNNDASVSSVNLNNTENISRVVLASFAEALTSNTEVKILSLANTSADDQVAGALAGMLKKNRGITNLNVESNFITGKGILALMGSLQHNTTLMELRFHNQRHICGGQVETEMVKLLRENTTLLKLGYQFDLPGPRMSATDVLTRNQDRQRQRRLQQRRTQENVERTEHMETLHTVDDTLSSKVQIPTRDDVLAAARSTGIASLRKARYLFSY